MAEILVAMEWRKRVAPAYCTTSIQCNDDSEFVSKPFQFN
jgi:hypothetical protein